MPTPPATLNVFSTLATQVAWPELMEIFTARTGCALQEVFGPTNGLMQRIRAGETADMAILLQDSATLLTKEGVLSAGRDIAVSYVGLAVRAGAPRPDISTVDALKRTLLGCRSIAYSKIGASGVYFAGLIQRLGIADAVNAKATITPGGFTGERVANGETECAVQQLSELKAVKDIDIVGPFPIELQEPAVLTAAVFARSHRRELAQQLVDFLASAEAAPILTASGLTAPVP